jgi:hypothetical protein
MMENDSTGALGRKIFFLYPSALTQNQIITELTQEEYEVYIIKDEDKLRKSLERFPNSILFASVNEVMKESAWDELIKNVIENPQTSAVDIGIIASVNSEIAKSKYLEQYKARCGYVVMKSDIDAAIKQVINNLNNVNAKGRRKYLRMIMDKETNATVNLPMHGTFVNGTIKDISVVGFSCSFTDDPLLAKNGLFGDIQLRLQSQLFRAEGIVFGSRMDGPEKIYVILFTQRLDPSARTKIRKYIQSNLQSRLEQELV